MYIQSDHTYTGKVRTDINNIFLLIYAQEN
jgi:hypothetical protein